MPRSIFYEWKGLEGNTWKTLRAKAPLDYLCFILSVPLHMKSFLLSKKPMTLEVTGISASNEHVTRRKKLNPFLKQTSMFYTYIPSFTNFPILKVLEALVRAPCSLKNRFYTSPNSQRQSH